MRGGAPGSINPWHVVATRNGPACVPDPSNITLWRPDAGAAMRMDLSSDGSSQALNWPAGASTLRWPDSVRVSPATEYSLAPRGGEAARLRIVQIPSPPATTQEIAAVLIRNGCVAQLDRLVEASRAD